MEDDSGALDPMTLNSDKSDDEMSVKLRASSGTYNVRASELTRDRPVSKTTKCVVCFLDDTEASIEIDKRAKAQSLMDRVFEHLELIEKDYFGLQYVDVATGPDGMPFNIQNPSLPTITSDTMRWLDPLKTLKKQLRATPPYVLYFRVKFYVSDPSKLQEEYTRYHFFLQLKKDILEGKLVVPYKTAILLASYAVQSELGDYNAEENAEGYLSEFRFIPHQVDSFEKDVAALHKQHRGQTPADSEYHYLDQAKRLETYGVDLHRARDQSNLEIQLGVTSVGLVIFQNDVRINTFSWSKIVKISFKRKQFFIQIKRELNENCENLIGFNMVSYRSCKNLWKSCIEHHTFFRLHAPPQTKNNLFSLGSKFRYSGRTEFQTLEESKRRAKIERTFSRSPSKRYARRTVGATTREAIMEERNAIDGYRNTPHSTSVNDFRHAVGYPSQKTSEPNVAIPNSTSYPNSLRSSFDQESFQHSTVRATLPTDYKPTDFRTKSPNGWAEKHSSRGYDRTEQRNAHRNNYENRTDHRLPRNVDSRPEQRYTRILENRPDHTISRPLDKRLAGKTETSVDDDDGGFLGRSKTTSENSTPVIPPKLPGYMEDDSLPEQAYELPLYNEFVPNGNAFHDNHGLVSIRMKPDTQGRFGFNVKGGADQGMPIIVSRVAPGTPADICIPRLNEGDQVLFINGRDVMQHTHEQVVMFIRASRETHSGELVLVVRPNVYIGEDTSDEPDFQYIPDTHHITTSLPPGGDALAASLILLQEGLESGAALAQFEQMYRKKPGMTMNAARVAENIPKNRYRDISPYDQTRVKIKDVTGDYINANYVNMEIPGSGVVNRYIAAQGPLPSTCGDIWQMVWEQQCSLVVMLTTKVERGRVKCHQYWPDLYETADFGHLQVTCVKEEQTSSFAFRDFTLVNIEHKNGDRHIRQMQYIAWPDHGVPDDSSDFLDFVMRVRQNRVGMVEPTVVHCSAGIGRTGVLITMETAMCLIEANHSVHPLEIVRQMRDQRAMLIQTSSQYKFVCEAILRVYNEKIVKPLEEYKKR